MEAAGGEALPVPRPVSVEIVGGRAYEVLKRALDVAVAVAFLALFAPIWLVIALAIRLTSSGPALHRLQRVVGRDGREFTVYKFRTMRHGSDDNAHRAAIARFVAGDHLAQKKHGNVITPVYKLSRDPRVTGLGRVLRKMGIDEVPQFINVLRGDMSIVGPRPPLYYEYELYTEAAKRRLAVLPGITGLYQVTARSLVTFESMVELDLEYIRRRSLSLDLWIMLRTPWVMVSGKGAH